MPPHAQDETLAPLVKPGDEWIPNVKLDAFKKDIQELGKELAAGQGPADVAHLNKIKRWSNTATFLGLFSMWLSPLYLFPAALLSLGTFSRWTMVGHHVCHGGYDNCASPRFNRFRFAVGNIWRRLVDWFDWMLPEAWNVEHNNLHHYHLGEDGDPDLVERNLKYLRESDAPLILKYAVVSVMIVTWKWSYYAVNTFKELKIKDRKNAGLPLPTLPGVKVSDSLTVWTLLSGTHPFVPVGEFFTKVVGPYLVWRFGIVPLTFLFVGNAFGVGSAFYWNAVLNLILADLLTNTHAFVAIVTNHAGDDLYRFDTHTKPRSGTFYLRQVISSANFSAGTDVVDFMHGWLNYQIEHHLWPDLSMLSYQRAMPRVKLICAKHGVPYIQHNVFRRVKKTVDIMVGATSMRQFPAMYDKPLD
eukprot:CAMPEP_0114550908 /NCGR_PEP_ID=MMETSP0114-20121206/6322_1 /TAXON_ID=31324 /ORGANISM="Goniomonas sp, Strain m" /LENGTH=414 /DNA_ID=CAMNT_0001735709 /DNA_START=6 /DNA_END=1250 /DNA_ORIENTATION=+